MNSQRLSTWCSSSRLRGPQPLPVGVAAPHSVLSGQPVSLADILMVSEVPLLVTTGLAADVLMVGEVPLLVTTGLAADVLMVSGRCPYW